MERYRDIRAERIVRSLDSLEIYGHDLDGKPVWIWVHLDSSTEEIEQEEVDPLRAALADVDISTKSTPGPRLIVGPDDPSHPLQESLRRPSC